APSTTPAARRWRPGGSAAPATESSRTPLRSAIPADPTAYCGSDQSLTWDDAAPCLDAGLRVTWRAAASVLAFGGLSHPRGATPMSQVSPGWYPDPSGRFAQRYHDGTRWTEHVADAGGQRSVDNPEGQAAPAADPYAGQQQSGDQWGQQAQQPQSSGEGWAAQGGQPGYGQQP